MMRRDKTKKEKQAWAKRQAAFRKRFQKTDVEYLEYLVKVSENAANSTSEELNSLFMNQANRIRKEIEELKKK